MPCFRFAIPHRCNAYARQGCGFVTLIRVRIDGMKQLSKKKKIVEYRVTVNMYTGKTVQTDKKGKKGHFRQNQLLT